MSLRGESVTGPIRVTFFTSVAFVCFHGLPSPLSVERAATQRSVSPLHHEPWAGARCQPAGGRKKRETNTGKKSRKEIRKASAGRCACGITESRCRRSLAHGWRLSVRCDAAQPLHSSELRERVGHEAVLDTCVAARIDAQTLADLAALPITFCADRRSSWSIPGRCSSSISASRARSVGRCYLLAAYEAAACVFASTILRLSFLESRNGTLQAVLW